MPNDDAISKATAAAKKTLDEANKSFPSTKSAATTPVAKAKPSTSSDTNPLTGAATGKELQMKRQNIDQYKQNAPIMHDGGTVPADGVYTLQKGETVVPAAKSGGRQSEYRAVYHKRMAARQTKGEGGNSPAPKGEEKHDQPKAKKGIANNVNS